MMRIAVVTGAGSGIGRAISTALIRRGDTVIVTDIDRQRADYVAARLTQYGPGRAHATQLDVTDPNAVVDLIQSVVAEHGRLDIMINNAGIGVLGLVEQLSLAHWQAAVQVNLNGVIHGIHAAYPVMLEQRFGHIVNIASVSGRVASPLFAPYAATKHAVVGLSLALRAEAAVRGVKITVVCPGITNTGFPINHGLPPVPSWQWLQKVPRAEPRYRPEQLARTVLRAMEKNQAIVVTPLSARITTALFASFPALADKIHQGLMRKAIEHGLLDKS